MPRRVEQASCLFETKSGSLGYLSQSRSTLGGTAPAVYRNVHLTSRCLTASSTIRSKVHSGW